MSTTGLSQIDHAIQTTHVWLGELMTLLDWSDRVRAFRALYTVLPSLRDHLPVNEAAHLAAQLPLIIRGIYYEGYHPARQPVKDRGGDDFIAHIAHAFSETGDASPAAIAAAVFTLIERHVSPGETEQVKKALPEALRRYWPTAVARTAKASPAFSRLL